MKKQITHSVQGFTDQDVLKEIGSIGSVFAGTSMVIVGNV